MSAHVRLFGELPAPVRPIVPILRKGFRPFFFLAAAWAVFFMPVWLLMLAGKVSVESQLTGFSWHAHELLFGFTSAVIAGFLLTAVGNWTGRETATGPWLALLCFVWIAGRIAMVLPISQGLARTIDLAFVPALALTIARPLVLARNVRNFVMIAILAAYWLADFAMWSSAWQARGTRLALDAIVLLITVLTGRIVPMFTRNGTGVESIRSIPILDKLAMLSMVAVAITDNRIACGIAAFFVAARMIHWGSLHALRVPMLWILHAGVVFVVIGLVLRAIGDTTATHAFTVGAIGCTTLGMMARVALGHTGRPIATRAPMIIAFAAMVLAALVRVIGPHWAGTYVPALHLAGSLWIVAFAIYLVVYTPVLFTGRVDGKPG